MAKFATSTTGTSRTTNYMGADAVKQSAKEELAFAVMTSFIESSYYEKKDARIGRIKTLVEKVAKTDPLFVAKLAVVTRREFHMRSSSQALLAELSRVHRGDSLVQRAIVELSERPDDLIEIAAYLKKPLPNAVKKGIAKAIGQFDAYQLAKYRAEGKNWSLVDLFNLVRPKAADKAQAEMWAKLIKGELKNTSTWESKLSAGGDKKEVFSELLDKKKLGYMATLRNLRNIAETGDAELVAKAAKLIADPKEVAKSKQLPFRFLSAYEALGARVSARGGLQFEKDDDAKGVLIDALNKALTAACQNIPLLYGKTVILTDNSGSMRGDGGGSSALSAMSDRKTSDIANLFGAMYWLRADNTYVGVFGDRLIQPTLNRDMSLFEAYDTVNKTGNSVGGATEEGAFLAIEELVKSKQKVERIIMFTDCQLGRGLYGFEHGHPSEGISSLLNQYRKVAPDHNFYCVDLRGYGNAFMKDGQISLAGWSDKIFDLMAAIEKKEGLVKWVQKYPVNLELQTQ